MNYKKILRYLGPGLFIAVGYMDPGNWATDIAAGSYFGYSLLFVVLMSGIVGMVLQFLCIKLTLATGKDLATLCAHNYNKPVRFFLWVSAEIGIIACDLAEVLGAAIALNLLFHLPLIIGAILTILDTFLILFLLQKNLRYLEILLIIFIATIAFCFLYNLYIYPPSPKELLYGFTPPIHLLGNSQALLIAAGILGATVMPHNLYLHGYIINAKVPSPHLLDLKNKKILLRIFRWDSHLSLGIAFVINALILILAASHFHNGSPVNSIKEAYTLLSPSHLTIASIFFALALLVAGQNSTLTGTIAAGAIMEGFLKTKISPMMVRFITRCIALIPVIFFLSLWGESSIDRLLVLSQVVLSLQLPFAAIPLLIFTNNRKMMGPFANKGIFRLICGLIIFIILALNLVLIFLA